MLYVLLKRVKNNNIPLRRGGSEKSFKIVRHKPSCVSLSEVSLSLEYRETPAECGGWIERISRAENNTGSVITYWRGRVKTAARAHTPHTHTRTQSPRLPHTHKLVSPGWHRKWRRVSSSNLSPLFHLLCHSWFLFLLFLYCFLALSLTLLCKYCLPLPSFLCTNMGMNFSVSSHGNSGTASWVTVQSTAPLHITVYVFMCT